MECARIYQVLYTALDYSFHLQMQPSYCRVPGSWYVPWGIFDIRPRANRTALYRRFSIVLRVGNERLQSGGPAQGRATCNSLGSPRIPARLLAAGGPRWTGWETLQDRHVRLPEMPSQEWSERVHDGLVWFNIMSTPAHHLLSPCGRDGGMEHAYYKQWVACPLWDLW